MIDCSLGNRKENIRNRIVANMLKLTNVLEFLCNCEYLLIDVIKVTFYDSKCWVIKRQYVNKRIILGIRIFR